MAWELTRGLQNLRAQVNARWPDRDKASDGSIGDTAHMASTSGHNPDDTAGSRPAWNGDPDTLPEVRAWDMDSDLRESGTTAQMVVDHIRRLPGVSSVLRYMIFDHLMYHSRDGFTPVIYTGPSAHTEHIHFEGAWTQASDNNVTFNYRLDEVGDMATTTADAKVFWEGLHYGRDAQRTSPIEALLRADDNAKAALQAVNVLDTRLQAITARLDELTDPATPEATVASALVALLGSRAGAVIALMQQQLPQ